MGMVDVTFSMASGHTDLNDFVAAFGNARSPTGAERAGRRGFAEHRRAHLAVTVCEEQRMVKKVPCGRTCRGLSKVV